MQDQKVFKLYEELIKNETFLKQRFYIDIRMIKDIFLGMILCHVKTEKEYTHFYNTIKSSRYTQRIIDNKDRIFGNEYIYPTHDEIIQILSNKNKHLDIIKYSPNLDGLNLIKDIIIESINCHNIFKEQKEMFLYLNMYPFGNILNGLQEYVESVVPAKCIIINKSPKELANDGLYEYDFWMIYNLDQLLKLITFEESDISKIEDLYKLYFITPKLIHDVSILKKPMEDIKKDFKFCENFLNVAFNFSFIEPMKLKHKME